MRAADVLRLAGERGIRLQPDGDRLRYHTPPGALTDDLLADFKRCKPELIALLEDTRSHPCSLCGRFAFSAPTVCYWCVSAERVDA